MTKTEVSASQPLFACSDISLDLGGREILRKISLSVGPGEVLGIIGPNGAGKTSLFEVLSGRIAPKSGTVTFKGKDVTRLASMAKLKAGRLGREATDACLQYWGGMGFTWDNPVSRAYRDTRLVSIGGGADEIMLGIICKMMGILPGKKKG